MQQAPRMTQWDVLSCHVLLGIVAERMWLALTVFVQWLGHRRVADSYRYVTYCTSICPVARSSSAHDGCFVTKSRDSQTRHLMYCVT